MCAELHALAKQYQAKQKNIRYNDSDSEGTSSDGVFQRKPKPQTRPTKRRRVSESADEDVYEQDQDEAEDGQFHEILAMLVLTHV